MNDPVFVLGMLERSGTNYVRQLLLLHRDCVPRPPIAEDHLLANADLLRAYADAVSVRWSPEWGVTPEHRTELLRSLGEGLLGFVGGDVRRKRVVTKTPSVENLELFFS